MEVPHSEKGKFESTSSSLVTKWVDAVSGQTGPVCSVGLSCRTNRHTADAPQIVTAEYIEGQNVESHVGPFLYISSITREDALRLLHQGAFRAMQQQTHPPGFG